MKSGPSVCLSRRTARYQMERASSAAAAAAAAGR